MKMLLAILLLFFATILSAAGSPPPADTVIRVAASDTFSITLNASFGTGFSWQLKDSSFSKKVRYLRQDQHHNGNNTPGSEESQTFYFIALTPGSTLIRLIYVQPFKRPFPSNAPRKTVSIIIH